MMTNKDKRGLLSAILTLVELLDNDELQDLRDYCLNVIAVRRMTDEKEVARAEDQ